MLGHGVRGQDGQVRDRLGDWVSWVYSSAFLGQGLKGSGITPAHLHVSPASVGGDACGFTHLFELMLSACRIPLLWVYPFPPLIPPAPFSSLHVTPMAHLHELHHQTSWLSGFHLSLSEEILARD